MKRLQANAVVTLKAASGEGKQSPSFEVDAYTGGAIRPASPYLDAPLVIDLAGLKASSDRLTVFLDHNDSQIVGQTTDVEIGKTAVRMSGILTGDVDNPNDPAGKVALHARNGMTWKASIDGEIQRMEEVKAGTTVEVNGRTFAGPIYVARAALLDGFSFVSIGADRSAQARVAAAGIKETDMEFNDWLKAKGLDPAALSEDIKAQWLKLFTAEQDALKAKPEPAKPAVQSLDDGIASVRAKRIRAEKIASLTCEAAAKYPYHIDAIEAIGRTAGAEDWTLEKVELEILRETSKHPVDNTMRGGRDVALEQKVLEAALCKSGGLPNIEKHYDAKTLELADKKWRHGLGLGQLLIVAARSNGANDITSCRDVAPLLRAAFPQGGSRLSAAPSAYDVSGILGNVANKFIQTNFMSVEQAWRQISAVRAVSDFKQITSYSLTGDFKYDKLPAGGELKHGVLGETSYTNQADTYGRMFSIDRRDIINDDLGAFNGVLRRLGRGGALELNEVFWTAFLNNSAFFTSGRGNYTSGGTTALSLDALEAVETLFYALTDPDGNPLGISPSILLVPAALKRTALRLMNSTELRTFQSTDADGTGVNTTYGTTNTFAGDFQVVSSPYMSASRFTGYSAIAWYLLANPMDMPTIEVCFLNGVQTPTVEQATADFNTLGIQMRGYFDFGVATQEYRGGIKAAGA